MNTMKSEAQWKEEYEKCQKDIYYFFNTYCTIKPIPMYKRETLEGGEREEIKNIFLEYFTENEEHRKYYSGQNLSSGLSTCDVIRKIEKVTHIDGDVAYVLSFNNNRYGVGYSSLDLEQVLPLIRRKKLERIINEKR